MTNEIVAFNIDQQKVLNDLGLGNDNFVQGVVDSTFMHYMKLKMPIGDTFGLVDSVRNPESGIITVNQPYAHYINEGILYVDPKYGKGAFHDAQSGRFWSRPGVKKVPSNKKLNYHSGPNRGAHFVERTASENLNDIVRVAQRAMDRRKSE